MRDNARRLLYDTDRHPGPVAGAGLLAAVHRQPGDLQSVHPAGGRRGALASASPGSQPSAIGNRPATRGFSGGSGSGLRGYRRSVSGRSAHGETRHGWYLRGDSAEQLPRLAQYLAAARPALVSQVSVLLAVVPEHHPPGEHLAQSLRDWRRSIVQCRTWLNGLPPVWSVFVGDRRQAARPWKAAGLPSRRRGLVSRCSRRDKRPSRLPGGSGRAAPASRLHQTLWLESILSLAETLCSGHSRPAGGTSSVEPVPRASA